MMNMRMTRFLSAALLLATADIAIAAADFETVLDRHLDAIRERNLPEIEATITSKDDLQLIFPDGTRLTRREEYLTFHREWFASDSWTMHIEKHALQEGKDYGIATVRTRYEDTRDGETVTSHSWLTLTFRKEGGRWVLFHDQNTRITEP